MPLTDVAIRKAKPNGKVQKLSDGNGLRLEISKAGSKIFKYRFKLHGGDSDFVIGEYPLVSLVEARRLRDEARVLVKQGINPTDFRKQKRAEKNAELAEQVASSELMTFRQLYEEFSEFKTTSFGDRAPDWQLDTLHKHNLRFEKHVFPSLGDKPVVHISEDDLEDCLLAIQEHGTLSNRNKIKTVFNMLFKYAKGKRYIKRDTAKYISDALFVKHEAKHYKHVTTRSELEVVLQKLDGLKATYEVQQCLRLALLLFTRPGETAKLKWSEVDLESRQIIKEPTVMKMKRGFVIPLSRQALSILEDLMPLTSHTDYVFYSPYGTGRSISTESLGNALRRNGVDEINPHGFRHTASTALNEMGFDAEEIELQLSHIIKGTRGVYNKAEKLVQRHKLMQAWADYLERLVGTQGD
ncbi:tyrosine-type recombinase/integrase [Thiomicrorhabdus sediminis]|uniref:DUF4102 domain-containing protein n=1 Tax=Thiomicrorhabdus sediminis TaxID=2580412 RepID=A0A4P9K3R4_9GAMM|nr:integrase arm-type DNA-binding domain-containing protein [Thiomicrorhabdus sediminis]QCU89508.1 DUF4102 domain-containing protein [Thiomicrorhabdus sediminis]